MVYECYLDDSYDPPGTGVVTLAGYFGAADSWATFEEKADRLLNDKEVPIFHAIEFKNTKGFFKGWSRERKRQLVIELFDIVNECGLYGVSKSVKRNLHKSLRYVGGATHTYSPLGMAFAAMTNSISLESEAPGLKGPYPTHFFVESGNANNSGLKQVFESNSNRPERQAVMLSLNFLAKDNCRAIQLSDFCAYYSRTIARKLLSKSDGYDLVHSLPDPAKIAFTRTPHFIEVSHGHVTQNVADKGRTVNVGQRRGIYLGPKRQ